MPAPARRQAGSAGKEIVDGRVRGVIKHTLTGELLAAGIRNPSFEEILTRANRFEPLQSDAIIYRQAARQHICTGVARYFRLFLPPASWRFEGYEVEVGGVSFDHLWTDDNDRLVADELKTGRLPEAGRDEHERQLARQLKAGARAQGDGFRGVRVCVFTAPTRSFFAHPDGTREPLTWKETE
jgi:hypothetical protein